MIKLMQKVDFIIANYTKKEIKATVSELCGKGIARGSYNYGCLIALLEVLAAVEETGK